MIDVNNPVRQPSAATYAGDITPQDAWALLSSDASAVLVDVRSHPEWVFVGLPDVSSLGRKLVTAAWLHYPQMARNTAFLDELTAAGVAAGDTVILLCRSGVRSKAAAEFLTQNGFATCYNVSDGFEGQIDPAKHRGVGGWRAVGLPWVQS